MHSEPLLEHILHGLDCLRLSLHPRSIVCLFFFLVLIFIDRIKANSIDVLGFEMEVAYADFVHAIELQLGEVTSS